MKTEELLRRAKEGKMNLSTAKNADVQRNRKQIEQELIKIILKLDEYSGDISRCYDEINDYERLIDEAENARDGFIRDWYNAD